MSRLFLSFVAICSCLFTFATVGFAAPLQTKYYVIFKGSAVSDAEAKTQGLERIVYDTWLSAWSATPSSDVFGPRADGREYSSQACGIYDSLASYLGSAESRVLHWMRFRFYTGNYFRDISGGHVAIGLRGELLLGSYFRGSGITLGNNGVCTSNRSIAIERFGNPTCLITDPSCAPYMVLPGTCVENIFEDNKTYDIELHVSQVGRTRWIAYWVRDEATGTLIAQVPPTPTNPAGGFYQDDNPYIDYIGEKTGWFFAHVHSNKNMDKSFLFNIRDFQVGAE